MMKTLQISIGCLLVVTGFIACNSNEGEENVDLPTSATPSTTISTLKPFDSVKPAVINPKAFTAALNPAHGSPGHRCDLAVGAPLNSASAGIKPVQMPQPVQSTPVMQDIPNKANIAANAGVTNKATVTTGLNPAHGQPGHRCDISVGAPLNSAPAKSAPVQIQPPVLNASPLQPNPNTAGGAVKLNPPHGQPGHDCAVEVGKPLKQ